MNPTGRSCSLSWQTRTSSHRQQYIELMRDMFNELLEIRYSSNLFRLETAEDVQARVAFHNTGPSQLPGLIVMSLSDKISPDLDPTYEGMVVLVNANDEQQVFRR
jgi:pullulanase